MLDKEHWEIKHKESYGKYHRVTDFARFCFYNFMKDKKGKVLDLCCGKGADAVFFYNKGFNVTAIDYSAEAIAQFNEKQKEYDVFISNLVKDISEGLPFEDNSFDYVYVRLGLHYFKDEKLREVVDEIKRVLKNSGKLMFQVKSTADKEYGKGEEIETDMYQDESGYIRHFFSKDYAVSILDGFNVIVNEERIIHNGSAYLEVIAQLD